MAERSSDDVINMRDFISNSRAEEALVAAYQKGFHDARYYPNRRQPAVEATWDGGLHVAVKWDSSGIEQVPAPRLDGRAP